MNFCSHRLVCPERHPETCLSDTNGKVNPEMKSREIHGCLWYYADPRLTCEMANEANWREIRQAKLSTVSSVHLTVPVRRDSHVIRVRLTRHHHEDPQSRHPNLNANSIEYCSFARRCLIGYVGDRTVKD